MALVQLKNFKGLKVLVFEWCLKVCFYKRYLQAEQSCVTPYVGFANYNLATLAETLLRCRSVAA